MARKPRIEYLGALLQVIVRGNARQAIFRDDRDRKSFLDVPESLEESCNWLRHAHRVCSQVGVKERRSPLQYHQPIRER
jgi:REP-associated tyrosine transposase